MLSHVSCADFHSLPSGQRYLLPSCPRHTGHRGLRRSLQLLGQRRPHQVEDLGAARPAHHGLLLQPQRQHLRIRFQLRLVEGRRQENPSVCFTTTAENCRPFLTLLCFSCEFPQGHEYYNPQKKNYIFLRNAAEELKPRNKKWWEKGSRRLWTWRPRGSYGGCPSYSTHLVTRTGAFHGTPWPPLACMNVG